MSRYVDPNKPLSDSDRAYLLARGYDEQVATMDARAESAERGELEVETELVVDDDLVPYEEMLLPALQEECRQRELPVGGTKPQLIKRLEENDALREQQS
jgi:hypothetical protein